MIKNYMKKVGNTLLLGLVIAIFGIGTIWAINDSGYNWANFPLYIVGILAIIGILLLVEKIDINKKNTNT